MREQCAATEIVINVIGARQRALRKSAHQPDWQISSSPKTGTNSERVMISHRKWMMSIQMPISDGRAIAEISSPFSLICNLSLSQTNQQILIVQDNEIYHLSAELVQGTKPSRHSLRQ
jgi:hypothetical protein